MSTISFRCSDEDREKIQQSAHAKNMSITKYILHACDHACKTNAEHELSPNMICNIHTYLNRLDCGLVKKKDFVKYVRQELSKWQY